MLSRTILSTEDEEIREIGAQLGLEIPFIRPQQFAQDDTPTLPVIQHAVSVLQKEGFHANTIVILQPTSPLRTAQHIDDAIDIFLNHEVDSLVSVVEVPHNVNPYSVMTLELGGTVKPFLPLAERENLRQKKPKFYARNGAAIYICTYHCLMKKNSIYGEKILPYLMKKEDSFDIDDELDWWIVEQILTERNSKNK